MAPRKAKAKPVEHFRRLADRGPAPVYALDGVDVLVADFAERVRSAVFPPGAMGVDFNLDRFVGAEVKMAKVLDHAQTLPAFAPRRLIVIQQAEPLLERLSDDEEDAFLAYLKAPSPTTTLLLVATSKFDARKRVYKALQSAGAAVRMEPPADREMPGAIRERAKLIGAEIDRDAAAALAERVGVDLGEAFRALERLVLFVGPRSGRPIGLADVEAVVDGVAEEDAFALVEAIGAGRRDAVARGLHQLLAEQREPPIKFLGALAWHYRNLLRAREALDAGQAAESAVKGAPSRRSAVVRVARQGSVGRFARGLAAIAEADAALKGGSLDDQRALERLAQRLRDDP